MPISTLNTTQLERCMKCNLCAEVCPMMEVNPMYPGPKQAGPDQERYRMKDPRFFASSLEYCLQCRRCESACPSSVKVADIIQLARFKYARHRHLLRSYMLASTDCVGSMASAFAPVVNTLTQTKLSAALSLVGIAPKRQFPTYSATTFTKWFSRHVQTQQSQYAQSVHLFHGCYVNYNYPALGQDLVHLLNACGIGVKLIRGEQCCGVAMIANGLQKRARKMAIHNIRCMSGLEGPILVLGSTCALTLREEYPDVLGVDNSAVCHQIESSTKWLYQQVEKGQIKLAFRSDFKRKVIYHIPCHMLRLGWSNFTVALLRLIPGLRLMVPEQQCCGIAGTFGFKKEYFDYSQQIGSSLFSTLLQSGADVVVTDCETCKWQIEQGTHLPVMHPISLLFEALDLPATIRLNNA